MLTENKTTEFKREYVDDIKKTIIAFANSDGGTLYIGVNDDGTVCGVDKVDDTMLRVTNAVRDAVRPDITLFVECRNELADEKELSLLLFRGEQPGPITCRERESVRKESMSARGRLPFPRQRRQF